MDTHMDVLLKMRLTAVGRNLRVAKMPTLCEYRQGSGKQAQPGEFALDLTGLGEAEKWSHLCLK